MAIALTPLAEGDRAAIEAVLRSDDTFRDGEVAVALELVDDALGRLGTGDDGDYWVQVAREGEDDVEPRVAGYICYGPTPMTDATYDLYWIVVDQAFRGRGVARQLIAGMEADLRGRGGARIRVETEQIDSYSAARKLYQACGYPLAATLRDFYRPGEDLLIYYKEL